MISLFVFFSNIREHGQTMREWLYHTSRHGALCLKAGMSDGRRLRSACYEHLDFRTTFYLLSPVPPSFFSTGLLHHWHLCGVKFVPWTDLVLNVQQLGEGTDPESQMMAKSHLLSCMHCLLPSSYLAPCQHSSASEILSLPPAVRKESYLHGL